MFRTLQFGSFSSHGINSFMSTLEEYDVKAIYDSVELSALLAQINGDSPSECDTHLTRSHDSRGVPTDPIPVSEVTQTFRSGKSLSLRKSKQSVRAGRDTQLSMPTIEGDCPDVCTSVSRECPFPGPVSPQRCGEGLELERSEGGGESNTVQQVKDDMGEGNNMQEDTGLFHRERVLKYVSGTCLPLLENYVSSWVSRMVEEIVKMKGDDDSEVTPIDVGKALDEAWHKQMDVWTSYDDDNHTEFMYDTSPRLNDIMCEEYWQQVFSHITELSVLRGLLKVAEHACTNCY